MPIEIREELKPKQARSHTEGFSAITSHTEPITFHAVYETACTQMKGNCTDFQFLTFTGETEVHELTVLSNDLELLQNLRTAKKVIEYAQKIVLFSSNYPQRSKIVREFINSTQADEVNCYLDSIEDAFTEIKAKSGLDPELRAHLFRMGNCSEMTSVGIIFAQEENLTDSIEKFCIIGGDHVFSVIGRDPRSDPSNYKTWGKNAVVCDPWSGAYYPAFLLEDYLKDYKGLVHLPNGVWECEVERFNPEIQELAIHPPLHSHSIPYDEEGVIQNLISDLTYLLDQRPVPNELFLSGLLAGEGLSPLVDLCKTAPE